MTERSQLDKNSSSNYADEAIDGLRVIMQRRGCKIQEGDVLACELAIHALMRTSAKSPSSLALTHSELTSIAQFLRIAAGRERDQTGRWEGHQQRHVDLAIKVEGIRDGVPAVAGTSLLPGLKAALEMAEQYISHEDALGFLRNDIKDAILKNAASPAATKRSDLQECLDAIDAHNAKAMPDSPTPMTDAVAEHCLKMGNAFGDYARDFARQLERELAEARFRPMGDNHHNAILCPYCNPLRATASEPMVPNGECSTLLLGGSQGASSAKKRDECELPECQHRLCVCGHAECGHANENVQPNCSECGCNSFKLASPTSAKQEQTLLDAQRVMINLGNYALDFNGRRMNGHLDWIPLDLNDLAVLQTHFARSASACNEWRPMLTAPLDGTEVELMVRHFDYFSALKVSGEECANGQYQGNVTGKWIDHNGGGWTWHGHAGNPIAWRPMHPVDITPRTD